MTQSVARLGDTIVALVDPSGLFRSTDGGSSWTRHDPPFGDDWSTVDLAAGDGVFFMAAVGRGYRSTDGLIWEGIVPPEADGFYRCWFAGERFFAVGLGSNPPLYSSVDLINWDAYTGGFGPARKVIHGNELYVKMGGTGVIAVSENGTDWESLSTAISPSSGAIATSRFPHRDRPWSIQRT